MKLLHKVLFFLFVVLGIYGCKRKYDKDANTAPDTVITPESINLEGDDRLNSVVFLSWFGADADGYVTSFKIL
jgi:hypothetical protein